MIAFNPNSLCAEAEQHYYDFLYSKGHEATPEHIIDHINQCQDCQEQLNQLKAALSQADGAGPEQRQANSAIAAMLRLHFAYIGKPVTCETVKPFLPTLLDPVLQIRMPTPITAHLDNCQQCSEDLETIQGLNLNRKQLRRISQLFAEKPAEDAVSCSEARAAMLAVISMDFRETSAEVLKHLCTCPDCRKTLYEYRESVRTDLLGIGKVQNEFPCESVSTTDIFDYVVPYGLDPATDQYAKFRKSLTSHLWACPTCLAKMQELHSTVYGIAERADSEIVTIYYIDESAKVQAADKSDELYADFPIRVETVSREDQLKSGQPVLTTNFIAALKQKVSAEKLKLLLKTGAVAAVALIAIALLLKIPTAKAVTIEKIYKAIEKVKNVYISKSVLNKTEPVEERWASRPLNIYISKTEKQLVLWDLANKVRKIKHLDTSVTETAPLTNDDVADIERKISGSLGLMPFYDISDIPPDAEWNRVTDNVLEAAAKDTEVYDLTWVEKKHISFVVFRKWRVFVDPKTNLPQRVQGYQRLNADGEYTLGSVMVVKHLSNSEVRGVIKEAAF